MVRPEVGHACAYTMIGYKIIYQGVKKLCQDQSKNIDCLDASFNPVSGDHIVDSFIMVPTWPETCKYLIRSTRICAGNTRIFFNWKTLLGSILEVISGT